MNILCGNPGLTQSPLSLSRRMLNTLSFQAILLCQYLAQQSPGIVADARVIELGSGTGLVGLVASALGKCAIENF